MASILCVDERPGERQRTSTEVFFSGPTITARALIRARVELELDRLTAEQEELRAGEEARDAVFRARMGAWLVRPDAVETLLNGDRGPYGPGTGGLAAARSGGGGWTADVERMVAVALEGFSRGHFFLFAGDRQVIGLDEELDVAGTAEVVFLRLLPLRGG